MDGTAFFLGCDFVGYVLLMIAKQHECYWLELFLIVCHLLLLRFIITVFVKQPTHNKRFLQLVISHTPWCSADPLSVRSTVSIVSWVVVR